MTVDIMGQGENIPLLGVTAGGRSSSFPQLAGFDYHLGALDNAETKLGKMYANLL